jgi:hypothetical protein
MELKNQILLINGAYDDLCFGHIVDHFVKSKSCDYLCICGTKQNQIFLSIAQT